MWQDHRCNECTSTPSLTCDLCDTLSQPVAVPVCSQPIMTALAQLTAPTQLVYRTWVREAQRALRLAVTGVKTAKKNYEAAADQGYAALSEVRLGKCVGQALYHAANSLLVIRCPTPQFPGCPCPQLCKLLLSTAHLPELPLGVLTLTPGLVSAASAKLARLQQRQLEALQEACCKLQVQAQVGVRLLPFTPPPVTEVRRQTQGLKKKNIFIVPVKSKLGPGNPNGIARR